MTNAAAQINDIRDIKPPIEIHSGWEWLWWTLGALALFVIASLVWRHIHKRMTRSFHRAADSRARPRETKIGRSARADFAAEGILRFGFRHDPFLSRRTI